MTGSPYAGFWYMRVLQQETPGSLNDGKIRGWLVGHRCRPKLECYYLACQRFKCNGNLPGATIG